MFLSDSNRKWNTYICPTRPATSVHIVSISSFKVCKAKILSSGSVSDKKPRTPDAEVKPGMINFVLSRRDYALESISGLMKDWLGVEKMMELWS